MKVAKKFTWEAAHRIPWHPGDCSNLHGHSYKMYVELEGEPDSRGFLMDFKDIKKMVKPLVKQFDHAILIAKTDDQLLALANQTDWKTFVFEHDTTAENMSEFIANHIAVEEAEIMKSRKIHTIRIRLMETETCYAEFERKI